MKSLEVLRGVNTFLGIMVGLVTVYLLLFPLFNDNILNAIAVGFSFFISYALFITRPNLDDIHRQYFPKKKIIPSARLIKED